MNDTTGKDEQEYNEPFDEWLRRMKPPVPDSSQEKEALLDEFRELMTAEKLARKNRLRRTAKRGSIVMSLAVLCVFAFNLTDLGSDGLDMVEVEDAETQGGVMKNVFRGDGFNVLPGETDQDFMDLNQQVTAGMGLVKKLEGWTVKGKTDWSIIREYSVDGKPKTLASSPRTLPLEPSKDLILFLTQEWSEYSPLINDGTIPISEQKLKQIDGINFNFNVWEFQTKEFGKVTYYLGTPIH